MAEQTVVEQLVAAVAAQMQERPDDAAQIVALIPRSFLPWAVVVLAGQVAAQIGAPAVDRDQALERLRGFLLAEAVARG